MSRVIDAEESLKEGNLTTFSFPEFGVEEGPGSTPKQAEKFENDFDKGSRHKFRLGGGFSFKVFAGLDNEEEIEQAEQFIKEVTEKAENIEKEAFKNGMEAGREAGRKEILSEFGPVFESFNGGIQSLISLKDGIYRKSEEEILRFVLLMAKKIIQREVEVEEDVVNHVIKWSVMQLIDKDEVTIKINPDDMEIAARYQEDLKKSVEGLKGVILEADSSITRGGCIIETSFGSVDARIEPQLAEIEKALRRSLEENRSQMKIESTTSK